MLLFVSLTLITVGGSEIHEIIFFGMVLEDRAILLMKSKSTSANTTELKSSSKNEGTESRWSE